MEDGKPLLKFCAGKDEYCLVGGVVVRLVFGLLTVCMGYGMARGSLPSGVAVRWLVWMGLSDLTELRGVPGTPDVEGVALSSVWLK